MEEEGSDLLRHINLAWLERRPHDLLVLFHPNIAMRYPGFVGRAPGREELVNGFADLEVRGIGQGAGRIGSGRGEEVYREAGFPWSSVWWGRS